MNSILEIQVIAEKLEELWAQNSKLTWTQYTTGFDFGIEESYKKTTEFLKDKNNYEKICEYKSRSLSCEESRQVDILYKVFNPYHLSDELNEIDIEIKKKTTELSKILNTHRCIFEGREVSSVELSQIIAFDSNRERRKNAFFTRNQVNKPIIDGGFIDLIKLRNKYAKVYGVDDFVELQLEKQELDKDIFVGWKEQLHEMIPKMKESRIKYANKYLNDDKIMPWDEAYINSKIAPALNTKANMSSYYKNIKRLFDKFGINLDDFNISYDIFPRANKSEWGYNFPIETAKDSRILANVKDRYAEYGVLLHETGHAVHSFLLNPKETILNIGVSGIISEGLANLFGSFLYDELFFGDLLENSKEINEQFSEIREFNKINSLRAINRILFDQALYTNNIESLDDIYALYWNLYGDLLKEEPFGEEPPWAYVIHHTTHPIYLHNYFMGDVTCEMLRKVFLQKHNITNVSEKPLEFGKFIKKEVIEVSGMYKFNELFKKISGEDFSLKYML